jgi:hypothetical protein
MEQPNRPSRLLRKTAGNGFCIKEPSRTALVLVRFQALIAECEDDSSLECSAV